VIFSHTARTPLAIRVFAMAVFAMAITGHAAELPEILVTAQLRESTLLETSSSISVVTSAEIRQRSAQHLEQLLNATPNVNLAGGSSRARFFQIRGVGERGQFQEPLNPSVGVLLDGVDFSGIGTIGTLFDVAQVEVLRGPQGTLHGANALAGLINIRSEEPTDSPYHRIEGTAGDYDSYGLGFVSSGPLSDQLRYRVAAWQYQSDGFIDNDFTGDDDTSDRDELTLRGKLRWLASENHNADLSLNYIDVDNGYDTFSLDNRRHTLSDEPGKDTQDSLAVALQTHSSLARFNLETTFSYADTSSDYRYDEDWTFEGFHPYGYSSTDQYKRDRKSSSGEVRVLSNDNSRLFKGTTDWVLGLYYLGNEEDLLRRYTYANSDFYSRYDTDTYAIFGELNVALSPGLSLIAGLRWEQRNTDYEDNQQVGFDPDKDLWGGRIALEYFSEDETLWYASISRGYRANGVNPEILASLDLAEDPALRAEMEKRRDYDEETLLNYEVGVKGSWYANKLQARVALFYMDRDDQQVSGNFLVPQNGGATTFVKFTDNAAQGTNYGGEFEISWIARDNLLLWANVGVLDTEFDDYVTAAGTDNSGRDQAHAPGYQYSMGGRFDLGSGFYLRLVAEGRDAFYFSDEHDEESDAYDLLHARLGYDNDNWSLAIWARNLTDEDYAVRGYSFGNDPRTDYATQPYYQYGEPRRVGVTASYTF
jgi:iron complex outermembrane receptor protein